MMPIQKATGGEAQKVISTKPKKNSIWAKFFGCKREKELKPTQDHKKMNWLEVFKTPSPLPTTPPPLNLGGTSMFSPPPPLISLDRSDVVPITVEMKIEARR